MIYLHHTQLVGIFGMPKPRLTAKDRAVIADYRQDKLAAFCQKHHLPMPMLAKDRHGKPYAVNVSQLSFNQAHSTDSYVLAYSLSMPNLGVDVESRYRRLDFHGMAGRYFSANERDFWQKNAQDSQLWLRIWTIKEAVLKASGLGIRVPLAGISATDELLACGSGVLCCLLGEFYVHSFSFDEVIISIAYPKEYAQVPVCWV